jgi:ribosomal protein S18 acetylase RimI-like enzyme
MIEVIEARPEDIPAIVEFNAALARETEQKELPLDVLTRGVTRLLQKPEYGQYFVALIGGQVVGCMMFTYEWSDWRDGLIYWLQSVYVKPEFRRRGVFRSLLAAVEAKAKSSPDVCGVRLYVERDNAPAQATYRKHGLELTHYFVMERFFQGDPAASK